jgi:ActR/RegA family two-component response regulator
MDRLLVVDDEDSVLNAIRRRLERHGFDVVTASTAEEGISIIRDTEPPFDAIITDMSIETPDSGLKILNAAFSKDVFAQVIVMTAYGSVGNAVECMRRGAFDYIEKNAPGVDVYEFLTEKVDQALSQRISDLRTLERWERVARSVDR